MNPPYGREIGKWMEKAFNESEKGALVVCLVPARSDTEWWHKFARRGEIRLIRGRLKFGKAKSGAAISIRNYHFPPKMVGTTRFVKSYLL